jgi:hypothetical protein
MKTLTVTLTSNNQETLKDALVCGARFYSRKEVRQGQAVLTYITEKSKSDAFDILGDCLDVTTLENLGVEWAVR